MQEGTGREGKGSRTRGVCLAIGVDEQQRSCRALCHQHIRFAVTGQIRVNENRFSVVVALSKGGSGWLIGVD